MQLKTVSPRQRRRLLSLPVSERLSLARILTESVTGKPQVDDERLLELSGVLSGVMGVDIRSRNSAMPYAWGRAMFSLVARGEGFSLHEIGDFLHRNHSSVWAMASRMEDLLLHPALNRPVVDKYDEFIKRISA